MNKLSFYIKKGLKDLLNPLIYEYLNDINLSDKYYYIRYDLKELLKGRSQNFSFDNSGIPIIPHYIDSENNNSEYHYFPIAIGQLGLAYLHDYYDNKNEDSYKSFIKIADWFVMHQDSNGLWRSDTNVAKYGLQTGWYSAMTQGRAISVLVRAFILTNKECYYNSALNAAKYLLTGDLLIGHYKGNFLLEYPSSNPPKVLNGFIFSLYGLYDLKKILVDCTKIDDIINQYLLTLENILPDYDLGYWTSYDLDHIEFNKPLNISTSHYHNIHVSQLKTLYLLSGNDVFREYASKWKNYNNNKWCLLRVYWYKMIKVFKA